MQPRQLRTSLRFGSRLSLLVFVALSVLFHHQHEARAEIDSFGVGNGHNGAKTVVGDETINSYAALVVDAAAGATQLTVSATIGNPVGFENGDLILVWRATGAAASEAPSGNQTKRLDLSSTLATTSSSANVAGAVGTFELARIASLVGPVLTLTKPLVRPFTKNVSQIVKVPEYSTVNVPNGASIRATPWQEIGGNPAAPDPSRPWAGGIVIFFATGVITNNGTIHANARGFHGGTPTQRLLSPGGVGCDGTSVDGDSANDPYSPKGEGVVPSRFAATGGGKGNVSMAGGGGNCLESGGGGGANHGNGGAGSAAAVTPGSGGLGGVGIDYDLLTHISMGGGGGAGRQLGGANSSVSFGGFGGGVVYVRGLSLAGTTGKLQASGGNAEDSGILNLPPGVTSEGSGGGGGGGTILVRVAGTLACDAMSVSGGNGGSAQAGVFGAGGGGGGGRVLFQAQSKSTDCDINVTAGAAGNAGQGGSQGGGQGSATNTPHGLCVPNAPQGAAGACADPTPVCDPVTGACVKCAGPFGDVRPRGCQNIIEPVCLGDGSCVSCNGDFTSGTNQACQLAGLPYCFATGAANVIGSCGKCSTNADCTVGAHPGPICNVQSGSCGKPCTKDEECVVGIEWCAPRAADGTNVCTPKTPNNQPVPAYPPVDGECTPAKGQRVCLSAVCEAADDRCGLKNSSPCRANGECRSDICFPNEKLCGLPNGEPCATNEQCRSEQCREGLCVGPCDDADRDCRLGQICDSTTQRCIEACRFGVRLVDGGQVHGGCPPGQDCIAVDGGDVGKCQPSSDAGYGGSPLVPFDGGDTAGIIEGGGCSCDTARVASSVSPLAALGAAISAALFARRKRSKR